MKQPRRKNSIRKPHWDYRTPAYYFVTICTHNRLHHFDNLKIKQIIQTIILRLTNYKSCHHVTLDRWVIMPNHIHLLIFLGQTAEYKSVPYRHDKVMPKSVGAIVGTLKKTASREIRKNYFEDTVWQRGYYDRIVRNEDELNHVREYIRLNPIRWAEDHENLDRLLDRMVYHA